MTEPFASNPRDPAAYADRNRDRFVEELKAFVRHPSVSAEPRRKANVAHCAQWLSAHLRDIGMPRVRVFPTPGHPIVYADCLRRPGAPTLLIYGHYDVQPPDPLSEWRVSPFAPAVVGERLFGRGASDDKGQLFAHVKALEAHLRTTGLPLNVKCLFEGEEEVGSPHLRGFVERNADALVADAAVVSDMKILGPDQPSIAISLRGSLVLELTVLGPRTDLHSGNFGGFVHNPLQVLCEMIARLHDRHGRIAVPGIYDSVKSFDAAERLRMRRTGPSDRQLLADAGIVAPWGEQGFSLYERYTIRPALTINGITGGYQGPGAKAVIPARGSAKIGIRLPPGQEPDDVERLFRRYILRISPPSARVRIRRLMAGPPSEVDVAHPAVRAAAAAYVRGFGARPVLTRLGGSIPIVETFNRILRVPTVLMGFALPDAAVHAPNENLHLPTFHKAIATCIAFLAEFAAIERRRPRSRNGGFSPSRSRA